MWKWIDSLRVRFLGVLEAVRASYGFVPSLLALAASAVAVTLVLVERSGEQEWLDDLPWLGTWTAESCRSILQAVASSSITVAGTVFSILIVALTLASSQFGPRLLRTFLRDRGAQLALGTFVATFLYSLLVLSAVRDEQVPRLATAGAVAMAVLSTAMLVLVLHRSSVTLQANELLAALAAELRDQVESLPELAGDDDGTSGDSEGDGDARRDDLEGDDPLLEASGSGGLEIRAAPHGDGYLRAVDVDALVELARRQDAVVELAIGPGAFVFPGALLARLRFPPGKSGDGEEDEIVDEILAALSVCWIRSSVQDPGFLLDQLVEMALRPPSPCINDPTTASACVHRIGAALCLLQGRRLPPARLRDARGRVRLVRPSVSLVRLAARTFEPIRRAGISHPGVVLTLIETAAEVSLQQALRRGSDDLATWYREFAADTVEQVRAAGAPDPTVEQVERAHRSSMSEYGELTRAARRAAPPPVG